VLLKLSGKDKVHGQADLSEATFLNIPPQYLFLTLYLKCTVAYISWSKPNPQAVETVGSE
jgi:hypothetical protein